VSDATPATRQVGKMDLGAPRLRPGALAGNRCHPARRQFLEALELPGELPADWKEKMLAKFRELLARNKTLRVSLDACVRCGACADKCQFFLGSGDPRNMPVARAELLRRVYRRYFKPGGRLLARDGTLTVELLQQWYTYFYQCSECRRCSVFCPYGIDTAEITGAAREIMAAAGVTTKYLAEVIKKVYDIGNNLGIGPAAWKDSAEFLEDEIEEETGIRMRLPVDEEDVDVLLVPPSADLFANANTAIGYAKFFHQIGVSWTLSTYASEGGNFGLFLEYGNMRKVNKRYVDEMRRTRARRLVMGECGHAWRAAGALTDTLNGPLDFIPEGPRPQHIEEYIVEFLRAGKLRIDKSRNDDLIVTLHDPCNVARATASPTLLDDVREVVRACCNNFIEMPRNTIREYTFCCGGGGGLLADEIMDVRMAGGKPRADAVRLTGANYLAVPCAICKAQLPEVMEHHKVPAKVGGVIDMLGRALVFEGAKPWRPETFLA